MKRMMIVAALVVAGLTVAAAHPRAGGASVSMGVFYSSLGIHGEWIFVGGDAYAWRPYRVGADWRPYWDGRWVWTDDGWYWVSDEPWAWAVYHYGRWFYDDYYGWIWIPGYEWAPAWVEWRYGPDYVGWAPLGPYAVFSAGMIVYPVSWVTPHVYWAFVPCHAMLHHHVHRYVYPVAHNARWIGASRLAGSVTYERGRLRTEGPERTFVERHGNLRVTRTEVVDVDRQGNDRIRRQDDRERIEAYRPRIERAERTDMQARPERFRTSERTMDLSAARIDARARIEPAERSRLDETATHVDRTQAASRRHEEAIRRQSDTRARADTRLSRPEQGRGVTPSRPDQARLEKPRRSEPQDKPVAQSVPRGQKRRER